MFLVSHGKALGGVWKQCFVTNIYRFVTIRELNCHITRIKEGGHRPFSNAEIRPAGDPQRTGHILEQEIKADSARLESVQHAGVDRA